MCVVMSRVDVSSLRFLSAYVPVRVYKKYAVDGSERRAASENGVRECSLGVCQRQRDLSFPAQSPTYMCWHQRVGIRTTS